MLGALYEVNGPIGRAQASSRFAQQLSPASRRGRREPAHAIATPRKRRSGETVSRVAIIGSCITRDLWPILGDAPADLLYISRTSLPSLFSPAVADVETQEEPPPPLKRHQHNAVRADLAKSGLAALVAHNPTHIIFDFIDERFDLLAAGNALATHSWELEVSGYRNQAGFANARVIPRTSNACERLWGGAAAEMASLLKSTVLRDAMVVMHSARWADRYLDDKRRSHALPDDTVIWEGRPARRSEHNALLARYEETFRTAIPALRVVAANDHHVADDQHRWGLSPFHYVPEYYETIWEQLRALGV